MAELRAFICQRCQEPYETLDGSSDHDCFAVQRRERDRLWCQAAVASLNTDQIEALTHAFNELRDDG